MFGFLAAFGPVGIAAAVVGTVGAVAYNALKDDDVEVVENEKFNSTHDNSHTSHQVLKNKTINSEIKGFKRKQKKRLKDKYNIEIKFVTEHEKKINLYNSSYLESALSNTHKIPGSLIGLNSVALLSHIEDKKRVVILNDEVDRFNFIAKLKDEIDELDNLYKELEELRNNENA